MSKEAINLYIDSIKREYKELEIEYRRLKYNYTKNIDRIRYINERQIDIIASLDKHKRISDDDYEKFFLAEEPVKLNLDQ